MAEITRRHLFALGAAAAVAPVLPPIPLPARFDLLHGAMVLQPYQPAAVNRLLTPAEFSRDAYALFKTHFPNSPTGLSESVDE